MKKQRLVFIINNFLIGGVEGLLLSLISTLRDNYDIEIISILGSGPLNVEFEEISIPIYHADPFNLTNRKLPFKLFWVIIAPITLIRIVRILLKVKPDVVITSLYQADILGISGAFMAGVEKRILIQHDIQKFGFFRKLFKNLFAFKLVTSVVANSNTTLEFLINYWNVLPSKITVVKNGINIKKFESAKKVLSEKNIVIGVIGRIEPVKGHQCFFDALRILKKDKSMSPEVIIVGDGSLRIFFEKYIRDYKLNNVKLLGEVVDIRNALGLIDILVIPSLEEGFGLVALEGLASAKIIVASNITAFRELSGKDEAIILFKEGNSVELANILFTLIKNPSLLNEHRNKVERWIKDKSYEYDVKRMGIEYEEIFK